MLLLLLLQHPLQYAGAVPKRLLTRCQHEPLISFFEQPNPFLTRALFGVKNDHHLQIDARVQSRDRARLAQSRRLLPSCTNGVFVLGLVRRISSIHDDVLGHKAALIRLHGRHNVFYDGDGELVGKFVQRASHKVHVCALDRLRGEYVMRLEGEAELLVSGDVVVELLFQIGLVLDDEGEIWVSRGDLKGDIAYRATNLGQGFSRMQIRDRE